MRESIFDIINNSEVVLEREYHRIKKLFGDNNCISSNNYDGSIEGFINEFVIRNWKYRKRCLSLKDIYSVAKIRDEDMKENNFPLTKMLQYIELVYTLVNMFECCVVGIKDIEVDFIHDEDKLFPEEINWEIVDLIKVNIIELLEELNYEIFEEAPDKCTIIEKDCISTLAAEEYPHIANYIIEYRKYNLKGNIEEKRQLLHALSNSVDRKNSIFKGTTYNEMYQDTTFLLNNLNIRHDNTKDKLYQSLINSGEIEEWYDNTYTCIIGLLVIEKYLNINKDINLLKKKS